MNAQEIINVAADLNLTLKVVMVSKRTGSIFFDYGNVFSDNKNNIVLNNGCSFRINYKNAEYLEDEKKLIFEDDYDKFAIFF